MGRGLARTGNSAAVVAAAVVALQKVRFGVNGFLRDRIENERSRCDTTAILIVRALRIVSDVQKKTFFGEGLST